MITGAAIAVIVLLAIWLFVCICILLRYGFMRFGHVMQFDVADMLKWLIMFAIIGGAFGHLWSLLI